MRRPTALPMLLLALALPMLLLALALPAQAEIYRWTDAGGRTVYGDTPPEGVEATRVRVDAPAATTPGLPEAEARRILQRPLDREEEAPEQGYTRVQITQPPDDGVVRTNTGEVQVAVTTEPALQQAQDHRIRLLLDGQAMGSGAGNRFALTQVTPGTHTLRAEVIDASGAVLLRSGESRFHLLRTTVQQQTRPRDG
ncbi:DUF4124 domain-containing protein [Ectothiorhodospira mobilis]|uniref:DUF4124 domain-containing protein n=1 Tax=Ectothiorhodospira mobilis TaxID=195064 RepID=UPI00190758D3|nr:DUF4124 domain-containing protein [Ectothiorhodospira mobilis]